MKRFRWTLLTTSILLATGPARADVAVEMLEGMPDKKAWALESARVTESYTEKAFGFVAVPRKFSDKGVTLDRSSPFVLRAVADVEVKEGAYRLLLRSRNASRLYIDDKLVAQTEFLKRGGGAHETVPALPSGTEPGLRPMPLAHQEQLVNLRLTAGVHRVRLEAVIGGQKLRPEVGEICVGISGEREPFRLLSPTTTVPLSDEGWSAYAADCLKTHRAQDDVRRRSAQAEEFKYWASRHDLARRAIAGKPAVRVPDLAGTTPVHNDIDRFLGKKLEEKAVTPAPLTDDHAFLRRVTLDTVGVNPTPAEIASFLADRSPERRARVIDRLLADPRWADNWVGYWQDVLAENPGILKPTLNNTGPFRWWIHQAFVDNLPMDRFVTELVLMNGSTLGGGPAGFGMASQNDAPLAAKAHILAKAFLGVDLQCARCHDAPKQPFTQKDTFSLAAMLGKQPATIPVASTVRIADDQERKPRVKITLHAGDKIPPAWTLAEIAPADLPSGVLREPNNTRERLAAILTVASNERFSQVLVNRLWKRYFGLGLVEPVDDWFNAQPSHPELLDYLARALVSHDYDLKHVARLMLNSHAYQRAVVPSKSEPALFASPARRRLSAEQIVDASFAAVGKEFRCEELNMDPECRQSLSDFLNLGTPRRAWEFAALSNERDRPALAMPIAQSVIDMLTTFGWRDSRQNPLTVRDETPTPLQPALLANGVVGSRITRLSDDSAVTDLCLQDVPLPELVRRVFVQLLARPPQAEELQLFVALLQEGYEARRVPGFEKMPKQRPEIKSAVSWANHLNAEATKIKMEMERATRLGDPATRRLQDSWRERMEDMLWALVNSPEFVFVP